MKMPDGNVTNSNTAFIGRYALIPVACAAMMIIANCVNLNSSRKRA